MDSAGLTVLEQMRMYTSRDKDLNSRFASLIIKMK